MRVNYPMLCHMRGARPTSWLFTHLFDATVEEVTRFTNITNAKRNNALSLEVNWGIQKKERNRNAQEMQPTHPHLQHCYL